MRELTFEEIDMVSGGRPEASDATEVVVVRASRAERSRLDNLFDKKVANFFGYYFERLADFESGAELPVFQEVFDYIKAEERQKIENWVLTNIPKIRNWLRSLPTKEYNEAFWNPNYGVMTSVR